MLVSMALAPSLVPQKQKEHFGLCEQLFSCHVSLVTHTGYVTSAAGCQSPAMKHHLLKGQPFQKVVFGIKYMS